MVKASTLGVTVSVETNYQADFSDPANGRFLFAYQITIENGTNAAIQLVRRHWDIIDTRGIKRVVDGEGVVGELPIILPGESHQYVSGCELATEVGSMQGYYTFKQLDKPALFRANIPHFTLVAGYKLN
ncbi:MAG: Co2+/Mg2+ efflux protein ApaG [Sphingobacteriaceae bacterium]